jgi:D-beta-D-heptose 7-phosphate kinase/D-beta-D-heptose 1-phosphate adenosyltransferase
MLDRYVFGDAERISPEAPVPVLRVIERQDRVGGAGSVAMNVVALGGEVVCCGVLGQDGFGDRVRDSLSQAGCDVRGLIRVGDRPTITKTRLVGLAEHRHRQQIIRIDDELVRPLSAADEAGLLAVVRAALPACEVVCLEDYAKGLLAPSTCAAVVGLARELRKPVFVDPARSPEWAKYAGAALLTPNRAEFEIAARRRVSDADLPAAAAALIAEHDFEGLLITLGRDGALLVRRGGAAQSFPTTPRAVYDNTGAGDAVLAMFAVAVAAGANFEQATMLANIAGGLEVSKFGCVPISRDEVLHELHSASRGSRGKIKSVVELRAELDGRRQRGETIVMTNGCFDILHPGHIELLEKTKALGSVLVAAINSDASVRQQNKGPGRPIRGQADRARMLAALECVDYVVVFDEPTPAWIVEQIAPDVLVKGADWSHLVVGREFVESRGGRVVLLDLVEGYSTTHELERIRNRE